MPKTWLGRDENGILQDFTADFTDTVPPEVESGGVQTIRLLGPYTVTHATPGIGGPYPTVALIGDALPLEAIIFAVWAIPYVGWAAGATAAMELDVFLGDRADMNTSTTLMGRLVRVGGSPLVESRGSKFASMRIHTNSHTAGDPLTRRITVVQAANVGLAVYVTDDGGNEVALTAGEADIYALIAEPA